MLIVEESPTHHLLTSPDESFLVELAVTQSFNGRHLIHGKCRYPVWASKDGDPQLWSRFQNLDRKIASSNFNLIAVCRPKGELDTLTKLAIQQEWLNSLGFIGERRVNDSRTIIEVIYTLSLPLIEELSEQFCERTRPFRLEVYDGGVFPGELQGQKFRKDGTILVANSSEGIVHDFEHLVGLAGAAGGMIIAMRGQNGSEGPQLKDTTNIGIAKALDKISAALGKALLGKSNSTLPIEDRVRKAYEEILWNWFKGNFDQKETAKLWTQQTLDLVELARALPPLGLPRTLTSQTVGK